MEERLQKILARAGYGSRRSCEDLISSGRVRVNGQAVGLGDKADAAKDKITVDGTTGQGGREAWSTWHLYKPRGVISTVSDPELRPAVRDLVPVSRTLYPVGRLDFDSEGLVLMTNDGDLANKLTHPTLRAREGVSGVGVQAPRPGTVESLADGAWSWRMASAPGRPEFM